MTNAWPAARGRGCPLRGGLRAARKNLAVGQMPTAPNQPLPTSPSRSLHGFDTHRDFVEVCDINLIAGLQTLHEGLHLRVRHNQ
jgi:hypothetical protein